jgi:hypothetical protein
MSKFLHGPPKFSCGPLVGYCRSKLLTASSNEQQLPPPCQAMMFYPQLGISADGKLTK